MIDNLAGCGVIMWYMSPLRASEIYFFIFYFLVLLKDLFLVSDFFSVSGHTGSAKSEFRNHSCCGFKDHQRCRD